MGLRGCGGTGPGLGFKVIGKGWRVDGWNLRPFPETCPLLVGCCLVPIHAVTADQTPRRRAGDTKAAPGARTEARGWVTWCHSEPWAQGMVQKLWAGVGWKILESKTELLGEKGLGRV